MHPSRYGALLDDVTSAHWRGVAQLADVSIALRTVVLVDRMYDRDLPLAASGIALDGLLTEKMLASGQRKEYRRALSRLTAMACEEAEGLHAA